MKCAIVSDFNEAPHWGQMAPPTADPSEMLVRVHATALSQLTRSQASGRHYAGSTSLPLIPGVDGVGTLPNGQRVYFSFPRPPFGAMAELVPVASGNYVPVPDEVDDATAAVVSNPGISSWAALTERAKFRAGEVVLINGATGVSGRLAVQIAKYLRAGAIIATARSAQSVADLEALGANVVVPLDLPEDELTSRFSNLHRYYGVDIVLDYLWGKPAEILLASFGGSGDGDAERRVRYVQIGSVAGANINLAGGILRSSGLEVLGSGLGSVARSTMVQCAQGVLGAAAQGALTVSSLTVPLSEVDAHWNVTAGPRVVFTLRM